MAAVGTIVLLAAGLNVTHIETGPITEGIEKPSFQEMCHSVIRGTPEGSRFIF